MFSWLPLATIVDSKVLIVHGGVSDTTDLVYLDNIERHKVQSHTDTGFSRLGHMTLTLLARCYAYCVQYVSALRPPMGDNEELIDVSEWQQVS